MRFKKFTHLKKFLSWIIIFALGIGVGYLYFTKTTPSNLILTNKNKYSAFLSEIYDKTKENYWEVTTDEQLINLYKLGIDKFSGLATSDKPKNKEELMTLIEGVLKNQDDKQKKEFTVNLASAVLSSLNPAGRSGLFNQKQEEQLKNTVQNVNPDKDLYKDLGLGKGASQSEVEESYKKQSAELEKIKDSSPEAKKKLETITYAKDVLTKEETKKRYDSTGVEPTASTKLITPNVFYFKLDKFSPTSFDEFQKGIQNTTGPNSLIIDLRGNIGGAIDITPYFIGVFIGKNQHAFDFYRKGDYTPFRTQIDKLPAFSQYKQIVVLIDNSTQSSAEILAASLKRYNIATVVGVPSKGWGTVERVFPLDNQLDDGDKYSMFLVHSITIRDDGQPIEGRGVEPNVNIKDGNWVSNLSGILRNPELVSSVQQVLNNK